jgi:hypothetical protein
MNLLECKERFGSVEYKGVEIVIMQQPYFCGEVYRATGQDASGEWYMITWTTEDVDVEDESEACDWTAYKARKI